MDINNLASYMNLEPSQLMRAERCVEQGLGMYNRDEELTENYLREHLGGSTLKYAMHLLDETTTSYMGVQIHNQNGKFSAPTAGVYNSSSRPELKAKIKEKVLKKNERENKNEEVELEEASMKQARKNVGADTCWKGYKAKGTKTKNGKSVPNCVKEEDIDLVAKEDVEVEGYQPLPKEKMARQANKAYGKEQKAVSVGNEKETNKQMQRRIAIQNPAGRKASLNKEEVVNEEGADSLKDRRMERGGVDGNNRYNKSPGKPNTFGKKPSSGMSAMDKVVAKLKAKHGDNAIIAKKTVKNESVEDLEEKKMSKAAHKKAAKAGKRWQDSDGDGKWYEPGQDVKKEDYDSELTEQFNLLKGYLFENEIASTEEDVLEVFENITDEELEYCLEQALIQMKGKKKGNVIINPEIKKVTEEQDPDASKKLQVQKRQLMLNKQKIRLQQKATSAKQTTDMHTEENLQEVDVTTRANNFGAEIERTNVKQKKEKKSLKNFKQLSMGGKTTTEAVYGGTPDKKEAPKDNRMVVTNADKKANTKAYQNYKSGNKNYKAADHMS